MRLDGVEECAAEPLGFLLANAARYAPAGSTVRVSHLLPEGTSAGRGHEAPLARRTSNRR